MGNNNHYMRSVRVEIFIGTHRRLSQVRNYTATKRRYGKSVGATKEMRQWHVDTRIMCRQHLLGEHVEHHMFLGSIKRSRGLNGYVRDNCLAASTLVSRHKAIADEMIKRGMNHKSPFVTQAELNKLLAVYDVTIRKSKVDSGAALDDLLSRCAECRKRYELI